MNQQRRQDLSDGAIAACIAVAADSLGRAIQLTERCKDLGINQFVPLDDLKRHRDGLLAYKDLL